MHTIPESLTEFLFWVKEQTEKRWQVLPDAVDGDLYKMPWYHNAKWIGMEPERIAEAEQKYGVQFMPEHKEFLKILHTLDRKEVTTYYTDDEGVVNKDLFSTTGLPMRRR